MEVVLGIRAFGAGIVCGSLIETHLILALLVLISTEASLLCFTECRWFILVCCVCLSVTVAITIYLSQLNVYIGSFTGIVIVLATGAIRIREDRVHHDDEVEDVEASVPPPRRRKKVQPDAVPTNFAINF